MATVGQHRLLKCGAGRIIGAGLSACCRRQHETTTLGREHQVSPWGSPEEVLRLSVLSYYLPRD